MARKGAAGKAGKEKKAGDKDNKKRRKARTDSYATYIYKVLKQVSAAWSSSVGVVVVARASLTPAGARRCTRTRASRRRA